MAEGLGFKGGPPLPLPLSGLNFGLFIGNVEDELAESGKRLLREDEAVDSGAGNEEDDEFAALKLQLVEELEELNGSLVDWRMSHLES